MKMGKALQRMAIATASLAAVAAWAHPGHGSAGSPTTILHLLTEPDHVLMLLAIVGVAVAALAPSAGGKRDHRRD